MAKFCQSRFKSIEGGFNPSRGNKNLKKSMMSKNPPTLILK
ncbi:MAG: hypothetical protein ACJASU_002546 [Cognaticolwellia sp.]|jgi:hypothetical protein